MPELLHCWWDGATEAQITAKATIRQGTGPFGATLHHLAQVGWYMVNPCLLRDARGMGYDLRDTSPQWLGHRIMFDAQQVAWQSTMGTRRDAGGMAWGVDHTSIRKSIKKEHVLANARGCQFEVSDQLVSVNSQIPKKNKCLRDACRCSLLARLSKCAFL